MPTAAQPVVVVPTQTSSAPIDLRNLKAVFGDDPVRLTPVLEQWRIVIEDAAGELRAAVAAEYRRSLAPSADYLERLWADKTHNGWRREQAEMLLAKAHNLAGSAGLFGLHALGEAAEAAEALLSKALKRDLPPDAHDTQILDAAVIALIATCRK